jgi:hypothetical protein
VESRSRGWWSQERFLSPEEFHENLIKGLNPEGLGVFLEALCRRTNRNDLGRHHLEQRDEQEQQVWQVRAQKQYG